MTETTGVGEQRILAGRYAVGEFIGQGGMSTVYRGTDTRLGRQVAIKIMKANLSGDVQFRDRFRQEAQSASRMAHPTVVRVFDAGDDLIQTSDGPQKLPFIVMEYIEGKNVRQLMSEGELSQAEACRIMDSVLTALEYSHRAGIVHRDIKPANIMVTKTGQVKVMDFGIARAVSETSSTVQQTTAILGTAAYFSPEQAKGDTVDARTDLYSAGVVLFEMLAGSVPFRGDTAVAVAYQHVSERPEPPSERNPEVSPELNQVVLHALAKDRTRRFQSAAEFRDAVRLAAEGTMPKLSSNNAESPLLFSGGEEVSESDLALRQLSENANTVRTQSRPPVMWTWAAILTVAAVIGAVIFWLVTLAPTQFTPSDARTVPDLIGVQQADATSALRDLDLVPLPVLQENDDVPAGSVIGTDPESGTHVTTNETIKIFVSTGPAAPEVPDLADMSLSEATAALEDLGLKVGLVNQLDSPDAPAETVLSSAPEAGKKLGSGETVDLTVSTGNVAVPNVVGQSMDAARSLIEAQRLSVRLLPRDTCPQEPNLPVIEQSLLGAAPQASQVDLSYCAG